MSYSAITFNVMIASPGDVGAERAIVRDVIYEWNAVHSNSRKIVLLPIGWESHSSPEMGASAQSIINEQVLGKCDLLVGVFWTRVGTPTEGHLSGTVEEIERHVTAGRPAMLYFSSQPVAMDTVDLDQVTRLKSFKESCQQRGLYQSYDSHADFRLKFYRQLQLKVNEHSLFRIEDGEGEAGIVESKGRAPNLSHEAQVLLKEASQDPRGMILHMQFLSGASIQTNGKNLIESQERREVAKWEDALHELVGSQLAKPRGAKGEIFELTGAGYEVADLVEV